MTPTRNSILPRVLIVDASGNSIELALMLQRSGHKLVTALDEIEAVRLATSHPIEFAMINVGAPGIMGYECARALRATSRGRQISLVAVAGESLNEARRIFHLGFDHHLFRPFTWSDVDAILRAPRAKVT